MKKFILSIMLVLTIGTVAKSQEYFPHDEWGFYGFSRTNYPYSYAMYDTVLFSLNTEKVYFTRLASSTGNEGLPQNFMWIDFADSGRVMVSPFDSLKVTWSQIIGYPVTTGKDSISGVAAMTSYVVAHNYGYVPVITLTARSADAAADHYISDIDSTTFTITFINQPPVGTDNIIFDWVATKQ